MSRRQGTIVLSIVWNRLICLLRGHDPEFQEAVGGFGYQGYDWILMVVNKKGNGSSIRLCNRCSRAYLINIRNHAVVGRA